VVRELDAVDDDRNAARRLFEGGRVRDVAAHVPDARLRADAGWLARHHQHLVVALRQQFVDDARADEAGAAGDEHDHGASRTPAHAERVLRTSTM
jgi:hypothetical protein